MEDKELRNTITTDNIAKIADQDRLSLNCVCSQINFLAGKILTVIDASYSDREQRKAVKDLIRNAIAEQLANLTTIATGCSTFHCTEKDLENAEEVELSEVIGK